MTKLQFKRRAAASGRATSIVVFVHGYGADGGDLLGLADPLAAHLPNTVFVAPDAPEKCTGNPFGFQWFPIPWLDGSSEAAAAAGLASSSGLLNAFLDARLKDDDLTPEAMALVGFSQGAMISLHVAPRRPRSLAGVVAISGRLLVPERLLAESTVKPPVLLVHGDADPVVPFASMAQAGAALTDAGFDIFGHVMKGTGHGIAPDGLGVTLQFLKERLPL
jgi:phospholipase/carboxylesterase